MFTGIIEELGQIKSLTPRGEGVSVEVAAQVVTEGANEGDSIAVNGVCLTALDIHAGGFRADGSGETLQRTTLGRLRPGSVVNLERAVTPQTRLGGHIVQGHVDARGEFLGSEDHGGSWTVRIGFPAEIARYLVFKGSITIEGISLTIANLQDDHFEIAVIPKTWAATNLSHLRPGDPVNLEADVIAKYVERLLNGSARTANDAAAGEADAPLTLDRLAKLGYG